MPAKKKVVLERTGNKYEFIVRYPWGVSAINGYRNAARHFGWRTLEDPTFRGHDAMRLLVHKDAAVLRRAAAGLMKLIESDETGEFAEEDLLLEADITWFGHDWKYWDEVADIGALDCMGLERSMVQVKTTYRVTLRKKPRTSAGSRASSNKRR